MLPIREHMLSPKLHLAIYEIKHFTGLVWLVEIYDRVAEKKLMMSFFFTVESAIDTFQRVIKDFNETPA